jgi:hypothetical protein
MKHDSENERPEFKAELVNVLNVMQVMPGNLDHANGEEIIIVTVANEDDIQPLAFRLHDAKRLVCKLLASLGGSDEFASKLLDDHFPSEGEHYVWPSEPYDLT